MLEPEIFILLAYGHPPVYLTLLMMDVKNEMFGLDNVQEHLSSRQLPRTMTVFVVQVDIIIVYLFHPIINSNTFLALTDVLALHQQAKEYLLELMRPSLHQLRHRVVLLYDNLHPGIVHLAVLDYFGHLLLRAERFGH